MRWIPVTERLPDVEGMRIAVYDPYNPICDVWPATWNAEYRNFEAGPGWFERDEVTHWTPLPNPPQGETE